MTDSIDNSLVPIFRRDDAQGRQVMARIAAADSIPRHMRSRLEAALARVYRQGIVDAATAALIARGELTEVKFNENNVNVTRKTSNYLSQRGAYAYIDSLMSGADAHRAFQAAGLSALLLPNIVEDREATRQYRESLIQPVVAGVGLIQKGEKIIGPAEIVTCLLYTSPSPRDA